MNLIIIAFACVAISGILKFFIIPRVENIIPERKPFAQLKKISQLAGLNYLQKFSITAAITYLVILLILFLSKNIINSHTDNIQYLDNLFHQFDGLQSFMREIKNEKYFYSIGALIIIFFLLTIRNAKRYGSKKYTELQEKQKSGKLPVLEPSIEMKQVGRDISQAKADLLQYRVMDDDSLTLDELNQKEYVTSILEKLIPDMEEKLKLIDIDRRIDSLYFNDNSKQKKKYFFSSFFLSSGMTRSIYKSSRYFNIISIALFLVSLLCASGSTLETSLINSKKEIVTLKLKYQEEKQDQEWEQSVEKLNDEESEEWDNEDDQILDEIITQYEQALIAARFPNLSILQDKTSFNFRSNAVREKILANYSKRNNRLKTNQYSDYFEGSKSSKDFSKAYNDILDNKTPKTENGKAVKQELSSFFKRDYKKWRGIKKQYQQPMKSFSKYASTSDVMGKILGETIDGVSNIFKPNVALFDDIIESYNKKATEIWYRAKGKKFASDLVTKPFQKAMDNIVQSGSIINPGSAMTFNKNSISSSISLEELGIKKEYFNPSIDYTSKINDEKAVQFMTKLNKKEINKPRIDKGKTPLINGAITEYKYFFPGQEIVSLPKQPIAAQLSKDFGRIDNVFQNGAGRSRSFTKLNKFKRVGGVIIGREPENHGKTGLSFNDINFIEDADNDDNIIFELSRDDGTLIRTKSIKKSTAAQALSYAADGRQVTVTMVPAEPFSFLKILLHPSLIDTELGCMGIELDRFVDKYSANDSRVEESLLYYNFQKSVYTYIELKTFINYNKRLGRGTTEYDQIINTLRNQLEIYFIFGYEIAKKSEFFSNKNKSFIQANWSFFDNRTIDNCNELLLQCEGDINLFLVAADKLNYKNENFDLPDIEYWSGVRERKYSLDKDLSFLFEESPLRFMSHLICEDVTDKNKNHVAWELPNLTANDYLSKLVIGKVSRNEKERLILESINDFTLAQRLFKSILNGDLGNSFPIEKLLDFMSLMNINSNENETPTWNINLSKEEYKKALEYSARSESNDLLELWELLEVDKNSMRTLCK